MRIEWNPATLVLLQNAGHYARIIRPNQGGLLCVFDWERKIWVRSSRDEGRTWLAPVEVASWADGFLTNGELLALKDGTLLCFFNARPATAFGERQGENWLPQKGVELRPFEIRLAQSRDGGQTWSASRTLYRGGGEFFNGCWEPAGIQLPSGEIQVFFANETPYRASAEQEISLMRSFDGGQNWSAVETIGFRAGHRDGMPSPLVLAGGRGLAVAIEDDGLSGRFKPAILFTTLGDNWRSGIVTGASPRRWGALESPLRASTYAGAPCLRQMPTGETLLSFQQTDDANFRRSRMVVCVGDAEARRFSRPSHPFPESPRGGQLWNSLFIKNAETVTAVAETAVNGVRGVWSVDGRVVRGDAARR